MIYIFLTSIAYKLLLYHFITCTLKQSLKERRNCNPTSQVWTFTGTGLFWDASCFRNPSTYFGIAMRWPVKSCFYSLKKLLFFKLHELDLFILDQKGSTKQEKKKINISINVCHPDDFPPLVCILLALSLPPISPSLSSSLASSSFICTFCEGYN